MTASACAVWSWRCLGGERRRRLGEAVGEERDGVEAEQDGAAGEEERHRGGAEHLELAEAVWVQLGGRAPREPPCREGHAVAEEVWGVIV